MTQNCRETLLFHHSKKKSITSLLLLMIETIKPNTTYHHQDYLISHKVTSVICQFCCGVMYQRGAGNRRKMEKPVACLIKRNGVYKGEKILGSTVTTSISIRVTCICSCQDQISKTRQSEEGKNRDAQFC